MLPSSSRSALPQTSLPRSFLAIQVGEQLSLPSSCSNANINITALDNGTAIQGVTAPKTLVICHSGDNICQHGNEILPAHLTYGQQNSGQAAEFVASVVA